MRSREIRRKLEAGEIRSIVFFDIDGTVVDDRQRYAAGSTPAERDKLIGVIKDERKEIILGLLHSAHRDGATMVALSGRTSGLKTKQQLSELLDFDYVYIRNSTLFNPDLSSRKLKANVFTEVHRLLSSNSDSIVKLYDDRADVIESVTNALREIGAKFDVTPVDGIFLLTMTLNSRHPKKRVSR